MSLSTGLYKNLLRPVLFRGDAEQVHDRAMAAAEQVSNWRWLCTGVGSLLRVEEPSLAVHAAGMEFAHPIGLAAGWDKNGRGIPLWEAFGFSHVEIGSVSAHFSAGNPKPRLFRVPEDRAIVVNYGLPNEGAERVAERLAKVEARRKTPLGVNLVNTNRGAGVKAESNDEIIADYVASVKRLDAQSTYLVLNLSCPNTCDGRAFVSDRARVTGLLDAVAAARPTRPVFLKVAPFADVAGLDAFLEAASGYDFVRGFSVNLPPGKPPGMTVSAEVLSKMPGAVSGHPAEAAANRSIAEIYSRMDRSRLIVTGSGGVFTAEDAWRKIRLGATLVQCLTALVYEGPAVIRSICEGLAEIAHREGVRRIQDAVGTA